MRVRRRGASRRILVRAQQIFELFGDSLPLSRRWSSKCVRHRTPSDVLNEYGLFLWRCRAVVRLYSSQRTNSGQIGLGLLLQAALTDSVSAGYAEIAGEGWCE